ncbi:hypothetical protein CRM75_05010 [Enterococcus faecium]|nr:hypothetical protein CRM75_05010 [Enterococcus faecium]
MRSYELPEQKGKEIKMVSQEEFEQLALPETTLQLIQVKDFEANLAKKLDNHRINELFVLNKII